ncbi:uncharacterized protein LOC110355089 isoform X3 [Columba livia]|uniref:uncharacterized protein LOC110355089 isoform X3 n=1 Tax=Columba livia TaxID=8932 RepID=UPI0031BAF62A
MVGRGGDKGLFQPKWFYLTHLSKELSPLCSMAKRRRSLAGPCMLEVLPKSGHQPWKASGMADFGQRALSPLGNILGMHIPFFFLATACFFLMAISSIAELLWDTSQENKLGKLRQVATMHLGLDFVISPESLMFSGWPGQFSLVLLGRRMSIQRCIQTQGETSHPFLQETFHLEYLLQHILSFPSRGCLE